MPFCGLSTKASPDQGCTSGEHLAYRRVDALGLVYSTVAPISSLVIGCSKLGIVMQEVQGVASA